MSEHIIYNRQFALFFKEQILRPDLLWKDLNNSLSNVFDQIPKITPFPDELRDDLRFGSLTIIEAISADGKYSCKFAKNRIDFFVNFDCNDDFMAQVENFFSYFKTLKEAKVTRVGFVTRFIFNDSNPAETISRLIEGEFKSIHEGSIFEAYTKYVTRDMVDKLEINNFTSVGKIESSSGEESILVTRDFNTNPKIDYTETLRALNVKKFISECQSKIKINEIEKILWSQK